jgi:tetratricopeptide (TPR) repeat protein
MGEVWHARDRQLGEDVAIKTIGANHLGDTVSLARFKREIQLARRIAHPGVCRVYDLFEDTSTNPPRLFLTMEKLDGETLAERIKRRGKIPRDEALAIFRQITAGLASAHAAGVVHRDLKPANVMLTGADNAARAVVMDFGLARTDQGEGSNGHTVTGALVGTPEYMAPEQIGGGPVTPATDVYGLGLILFEMLSGARPYAGGTTFESWMRRAREGPRRLSGSVPGVQRRIDDVIAFCLEYDPSKRFRDAGALLRALDSPWPRLAARSRTPVAAALALIAAACVLVVAVNLGRRLLPAETVPAEALRWHADAEEALAEGASVRALNDVTRALALAPRFTAAHATLAEVFLDLDMPGRAQEAMLKAAQLTPDRARLPADQASHIEGIQQLLLRNCDAAIQSMKAYVQAAGDAERAGRMLAEVRVLERCDRPDDAARILDDAAAIDARNPAIPLRRARLLARRGRYADAFAALDTAEALFRDRSNAEGLGEVIATRGTFEQQQDRLSAAAATLQKANDVARSLDDVRQQVRVMLQQAIVGRKRGDDRAANALTAQAIELARRHDLETLTLEGLFAAGNVHVIRNEYQQAQELFERGLSIAETHRHDEFRARARLALASVFVRTSRPARAADAILAARPYYERVGHTGNLVLSDMLLGQTHLMRAEYRQASDVFRKLLASASRTGDVERESVARENLGSALASAGTYPDAIELYQRALQSREASGRTRSAAYARLNLADLFSRLGRFTDADAMLASVNADTADARDIQSQRLRVVSTIELRKGNNARAADAATRALAVGEGLSPERTAALNLNLCLASARMARRTAVASACNPRVTEALEKEHLSLWLEGQLVGAEARLLSGDAAGAAASLRRLSAEHDWSDHEDQWRLLALQAAAAHQQEREGMQAAVTRELNRLRLQWGESSYRSWSARTDVRTLLQSAGVAPGKGMEHGS